MLGTTTMRRCAVLAAPLLLAACVTPERWQKTDASHVTTAKEMSECQSAARQEALVRYPYGLGSPTVVAAETVVSRQRDETQRSAADVALFNSCMQNSGYTRARTGEIGCPVFVGQKDEMQSRGALFAAPLILLPLQDHAQGPAFVGTWNGDVKGIGPARLIITAVGGDGRVEGRMEFELESFVSTFGDKADTIKNTNRGIVSGLTLVIDSALGGRS